METLLEVAGRLVENAVRVVALTGAGISTDSGIPDFRGPRGVWTLNPKAERMSDIRYYVVGSGGAAAVLAEPCSRIRPGPPSRTPATGRSSSLERRGKLHALITQNIDGLHQRAGSSPDLVIEVHGTLHEAVCLNCGVRLPMQAVLERVRARRGGSAVRDVRRHPQERHDLVRPAARARGDRSRDARRAARRTACSRSAPACRSIPSPPPCRPRRLPARPSSSSTRSRRRSTRSPT